MRLIIMSFLYVNVSLCLAVRFFTVYISFYTLILKGCVSQRDRNFTTIVSRCCDLSDVHS